MTPHDKNKVLLAVGDTVTMTFRVLSVADAVVEGCCNVSLQAIGGEAADPRPVLVCHSGLCERVSPEEATASKLVAAGKLVEQAVAELKHG